MVRLSRNDYDTIKAAADFANVSMGGLLRECAVKYASAVARDVREGSVTIRRQRAVQAVKGQVQPASTIVRPPAEDWMLERQRKLNAQRERAAKR